MKHVYFSGIGGAGIGPLALIAHQAGFKVSGSDKQESNYIDYLIEHGLTDIHIGQTWEQIEALHNHNQIDWIVYSSAVPRENPNHPELEFAKENGIRHSKRDEFLQELLDEVGQNMIAIAGTHGKTTTTAMMIWVFHELELPLSYSVGAKLSFGDMGAYDSSAHFFVYEADEYDRNFLSFHPEVSIIPGIDYDHPDIYPTREEYYDAFKQFISQSEMVFAHKEDCDKMSIKPRELKTNSDDFKLLGEVNRRNAQLVVEVMHDLSNIPVQRLVDSLNKFPGVSRRFEQIKKNIYTDYAHTPEKIRGALQLAREVAGDNVVVVYEGLHNTRQHFIKQELENLFEGIKKLIIVPSYLAREDESLEVLTPEKLCTLTKTPQIRQAGELDADLKQTITEHAKRGDLVLCLSAGGGGSLDEWLRREFQ